MLIFLLNRCRKKIKFYKQAFLENIRGKLDQKIIGNISTQVSDATIKKKEMKKQLNTQVEGQGDFFFNNHSLEYLRFLNRND